MKVNVRLVGRSNQSAMNVKSIVIRLKNGKLCKLNNTDPEAVMLEYSDKFYYDETMPFGFVSLFTIEADSINDFEGFKFVDIEYDYNFSSAYMIPTCDITRVDIYNNSQTYTYNSYEVRPSYVFNNSIAI